MMRAGDHAACTDNGSAVEPSSPLWGTSGAKRTYATCLARAREREDIHSLICRHTQEAMTMK